MRTTRSRAAARRPALRGADDGFGLVETLVAMTILAIMSIALLSMLLTAQQTAYGNRSRVIAANLAASEMDALRSIARDGIGALPIGTGRIDTVEVGGTDYTVATEVEYVNAAAPDTMCGTPAGVQLLNGVRVNVNVTWATMGGVQPVTSDSLIAPSFLDTSATTGAVVTRVVDRDGDPVGGASVTVAGRSAVTSAEGCAILTEVPPGNAAVTVTFSDYISPEEAAGMTHEISVVAGAATNVEKMLDRPARVTMRGPADTDYPVPSVAGGFLLRLANAEAPGGGRTVARSGYETTVDNLFPYAGGYQAFAGSCALTGASGTVRTATTDPGGTSGVDVDYGRVEVQVSEPAPVEFVPVRVNAGGPAVASGGVQWAADYGFSGGGKSYTNPDVTSIAGTTDDVLYLTERSTVDNLGTFDYAFAVPTGTYQVRLHFAEIYWGATGGGAGGTGKRVFSVNAEGGAVEVANLDLNAVTAPMTAQVRDLSVPVSDGTLNLAFTASVDQPKISAIEILPEVAGSGEGDTYVTYTSDAVEGCESVTYERGSASAPLGAVSTVRTSLPSGTYDIQVFVRRDGSWGSVTVEDVSIDAAAAGVQEIAVTGP